MAIRYLVHDENGEGRLPVSGQDGKPDHRLMAAAHAALFSNHRGNPYAGPGNEEAKAKLQALYKSEGMEWPGEGTGNREQGTASDRAIGSADGPRFLVLLAEPAATGLVRIPIAITGQWKGAEKEFSVGLDDLEEIRRNFAAKPTGEINVDYEHASEVPFGTGGPVLSAGRVVKLDAPEQFNGSGDREIGRSGEQKAADRQITRSSDHPIRYILWGWYEPTERARTLIASKEYRYISPAIRWGVRDKVTGKQIGTVLTSVALVNKPFLEEMPQIQSTVNSQESRVNNASLSTLDSRLSTFSETVGQQKMFVSLGQLHVPGPVNSEGRKGGPQISVGFDQPGGKATMAKLKLMCAADGSHEVHGPDGKIGEVDGDHLKQYAAEHLGMCEGTAKASEAFASEVGMSGKSLVEIAAAVKRGNEAPAPDPFVALQPCIHEGKLNLSEAGALADSGKVKFSTVLAAQDAERKVDAAIKAGKVLPKNRAHALHVALSDTAAFGALVEQAQPIVDLRARGHAGGGEQPTAQQALMAEVNGYAQEHKCSISLALAEITKAKPELWREYSEEIVTAVAAETDEEE
jgi:hypothetical protein